MKNKSFNIANMTTYGYICRALSKISKLALVGYYQLAHTVRFMDFFCMRHFSDWSTNPFQLCHPHLVVNGKASKNQLGAY